MNKPKKGGPKKWYVYVKNPKTGNVKKVSYGSPVMTVKWNDPEEAESHLKLHISVKKKRQNKGRILGTVEHIKILVIMYLVDFGNDL